MKIATPNDRLKQIMKERNLRQVDVVKMSEYYQRELGVKLTKSNISQYVKGTSNPDNKKIQLLAKTLKVSEGWLSGYDVKKELVVSKSELSNHFDKIFQSDKIKLDLDFANQKYENQEHKLTFLALLENFDKLEEDKRKNLLHYSDVLLESTYQTDEYNIVATMFDNSMEPLFSEGDRLMVSFGFDFKFGEDYLIEYKEDILIRRLFFENYKILLVPLNDNHPTTTIILPLKDHFKIIGKIIGKIKTSP